MWWCQIIDYLKFETRPSSLRNLGTANITQIVAFFRFYDFTISFMTLTAVPDSAILLLTKDHSKITPIVGFFQSYIIIILLHVHV